MNSRQFDKKYEATMEGYVAFAVGGDSCKHDGSVENKPLEELEGLSGLNPDEDDLVKTIIDGL